MVNVPHPATEIQPCLRRRNLKGEHVPSWQSPISCGCSYVPSSPLICRCIYRSESSVPFSCHSQRQPASGGKNLVLHLLGPSRMEKRAPRWVGGSHSFHATSSTRSHILRRTPRFVRGLRRNMNGYTQSAETSAALGPGTTACPSLGCPRPP